MLSDSKTVREQAVIRLTDKDPADVIFAVLPKLQGDISSHSLAACLDVAEKLEASCCLDEIRQDDWLEDIKLEVENFSLVARILGLRYLAYSILLGLQIHSLKTDSRNPGNTIVHFTTDDEMIQVLPLSQFKSQVTNVLLSIGVNATDNCTLPLTEIQAMKIIGELPLLVAPLFDISLKRIIAAQKGDTFRAMIGLTTPASHTYLDIGDFHKLILKLIQADLQQLGHDQLVLDLTIEKAQEAYHAGEFDRVVEELETWPGLLSTMLKTPAQKALTKNQLEQIGLGTKMLGDAFQHQDKDTWAKEIYRLGVRYVGDTPHAGPLYLALGQIHNALEQYGEAIGYLRRALALGENPATVYGELGTALLQRNKPFCAYLVFTEAKSLGATQKSVLNGIRDLKKNMTEKQIRWPY